MGQNEALSQNICCLARFTGLMPIFVPFKFLTAMSFILRFNITLQTFSIRPGQWEIKSPPRYFQIVYKMFTISHSRARIPALPRVGASCRPRGPSSTCRSTRSWCSGPVPRTSSSKFVGKILETHHHVSFEPGKAYNVRIHWAARNMLMASRLKFLRG